MKKIYVKPETEETLLEFESFILAGSTPVFDETGAEPQPIGGKDDEP